MFLDNPNLAISRVKERVKLGGHNVPEETIRRPFKSGLKNFFQLYKPLANSWQMYDNTDIGNLTYIASKIDNKFKVQNVVLWERLVKIYDEPKKT